MLEENIQKVLALLPDDAVVLDVGGWAKPLPRANWVIDLMPYETRGLYGVASPGEERFSASTWVERDICDREPWPFEDDQFDFSICSHTLEDVRDPIWVCSELNRVSRAGYLEVPSRADEQMRGVNGNWVGWSHHHWLIDTTPKGMRFVLKPHLIHGDPMYSLSPHLLGYLRPEERVQFLFWEGNFDYSEYVFFEPDELDAYLLEAVAEWTPVLEARAGQSGRGLKRALRGLRR